MFRLQAYGAEDESTRGIDSSESQSCLGATCTVYCQNDTKRILSGTEKVPHYLRRCQHD